MSLARNSVSSRLPFGPSTVKTCQTIFNYWPRQAKFGPMHTHTPNQKGDSYIEAIRLNKKSRVDREIIILHGTCLGFVKKCEYT